MTFISKNLLFFRRAAGKPLLFLLLFFSMSFFSQAAEDSTESSDTFNIQDYRGKVVYLDFWASWCIPCRKSFPWMNKMQANYGDKGLVIIAINVDKKRPLAEKFLSQIPANFSILYDPQGKQAKAFKIKGMPSSVLFDKEGQIVTSHTGFFSKKIPQYEEEILALLNQ